MALKSTYVEITDKYKQQDKTLFRVICEILPNTLFFLEQKYYKTFPHFSWEYFVSLFFTCLFFFDIANSVDIQSTSPPALLKSSEDAKRV